MLCHHDTYRDQLGKAYPGFGHALWGPGPGCARPPVEVGDVGYIHTGGFIRLFNALLPKDHPSQTRGVPEYYEQLQPQLQDHINHGAQGPTDFHSHGVTVVSGGLQELATG
jgi:hypothetical protein